VRVGRVLGRRLWAFGLVLIVLVGDLVFVGWFYCPNRSVVGFVSHAAGREAFDHYRHYDHPNYLYVVHGADGLEVLICSFFDRPDREKEVIEEIVLNRFERTAGLVAGVVKYRTSEVSLHVTNYRVLSIEERAKYQRFSFDTSAQSNVDPDPLHEQIREWIRREHSFEWKLMPLGLLNDLIFVIGVAFVVAGAKRAGLTWRIRRRNARDTTKCAACGYSLKGLVERKDGAGPRCPECGRAG
jgi:hypothetical protein